ncbi:hypothetical protein ACFQE5_09375 [Pseudonocardia hispaniensis]|uniref:Transposase n=1 Tax=Pseudonocardia hispaniensis TaxID=904933 RepID=A0ABW1J1Q6_9PSEU
MDVLIERCVGIDIGKDEVVACVRTPATQGRVRRRQTRTFAAFTSSLEAMADWFAAEWLAELLEHGLLRGSFVPPPVIRQLRDLTRYRKRPIQDHRRVPAHPEDP